MCRTLRNALYKGISVVYTDYDKITNFLKTDAKMDTKSDAKIDVWASKGPNFEVLGQFFRKAIFG